jgi:PAS domain S-box-containing protein
MKSPECGRGSEPTPNDPRTGRAEPVSWEQAIVAHSVDAILLVDTGGCIQAFNRPAETIFRCPAAEAIGTNISRFIPVRFRADHGSRMAPFAAGGHAIEMAGRQPVPALRADGEEFFAEISLVPVQAAAGSGVACILRDVTQRLRAEALALQSEKLESLRILSAGLAHDFNNILAVIIGNADLAVSESATTSSRAAIEDIREAAARAAELVRQMLSFAGHSAVPADAVDLNSLIGDVMRLLRQAVPAELKIALSLSPDLPRLRCDPIGLRRVIMNLVINARDAIGDHAGAVVLSTSEVWLNRYLLRTSLGAPEAAPGNYVCLEVADDGPGMDSATRSRIFDPFFTTKFAGRGLGLSSTLGIVRSEGGAIRVSSRVGKGTRFRIYLPVNAQPGGPPGRSVARSRPRQGIAPAATAENGHTPSASSSGFAAGSRPLQSGFSGETRH